MEFKNNTIVFSEDDKKIREYFSDTEMLQKSYVQQDIHFVDCGGIKQETLDPIEPEQIPSVGTGTIKDDKILIKEEHWWCDGTSSGQKEGDLEEKDLAEDVPMSESPSYQIQCKGEKIIHDKDCHSNGNTRIKAALINEAEIPRESRMLHMQQNETQFVERNVDNKLAIKQEMCNINTVSNDIPDPEESPTYLGTGIIKGDDEMDIKQKSRWCDGKSTGSHNEEKETNMEKNEAHKYILPLEFPRIPVEAVNPDSNSVTFLDVERYGDSIGRNANQGTASYDSYHFGPEQNTKPYQCDICAKCFTKKSVLHRHALIHSEIKPHSCDICGKFFTQKTHLNSHKFLHSGTKPYKCDTCDECFTRKSYLENHKILLHSLTTPYKCATCQSYVVNESDLQRHAMLHSDTKPHKCDICTKSFIRNSDLQRHILIHSGEKPYKCDICRKCFIQKSHLNSHKLLHSDTKPYKCDICEKFFTQKSNLKSHKLSHSGAKPFKCDRCGKCFTRKCLLQSHTLQHSDI